MKIYIYNIEDVEENYFVIRDDGEPYIEVDSLEELLEVLRVTFIAIEIGDDSKSFQEI